jgi:hypothetical protein
MPCSLARGMPETLWRRAGAPSTRPHVHVPHCLTHFVQPQLMAGPHGPSSRCFLAHPRHDRSPGHEPAVQGECNVIGRGQGRGGDPMHLLEVGVGVQDDVYE